MRRRVASRTAVLWGPASAGWHPKGAQAVPLFAWTKRAFENPAWWLIALIEQILGPLPESVIPIYSSFCDRSKSFVVREVAC